VLGLYRWHRCVLWYCIGARAEIRKYSANIREGESTTAPREVCICPTPSAVPRLYIVRRTIFNLTWESEGCTRISDHQNRQEREVVFWSSVFIQEAGAQVCWVSKPLTVLTIKNQQFSWGPSQQKAFLAFKERPCTTPVLAYTKFRATIYTYYGCFEDCSSSHSVSSAERCGKGR
jgi:hypothetical protein